MTTDATTTALIAVVVVAPMVMIAGLTGAILAAVRGLVGTAVRLGLLALVAFVVTVVAAVILGANATDQLPLG